jgi:hypothetical protein
MRPSIPTPSACNIHTIASAMPHLTQLRPVQSSCCRGRVNIHTIASAMPHLTQLRPVQYAEAEATTTPSPVPCHTPQNCGRFSLHFAEAEATSTPSPSAMPHSTELRPVQSSCCRGRGRAKHTTVGAGGAIEHTALSRTRQERECEQTTPYESKAMLAREPTISCGCVAGSTIASTTCTISLQVTCDPIKIFSLRSGKRSPI